MASSLIPLDKPAVFLSKEITSLNSPTFFLGSNLQTNLTEMVNQYTSMKPQVNVTLWTDFEKENSRLISGISGTRLGDEIIKAEKVELPVKKIYPHVFDENTKAGQSLVYLRNAINDAKVAIDAFGEPDLQAVGTRLSQIAVTMGKVYSLSDFNASLSGVVSFIRRASLAVSNEELTRSALNCLVHALEMITANPMLDLDEASDLVDKLASDGWRGEHKIVNELIVALADDNDMTTNELQALLFSKLEA